MYATHSAFSLSTSFVLSYIFILASSVIAVLNAILLSSFLHKYNTLFSVSHLEDKSFSKLSTLLTSIGHSCNSACNIIFLS